LQATALLATHVESHDPPVAFELALFAELVAAHDRDAATAIFEKALATDRADCVVLQRYTYFLQACAGADYSADDRSANAGRSIASSTTSHELCTELRRSLRLGPSRMRMLISASANIAKPQHAWCMVQSAQKVSSRSIGSDRTE
jgi:hypothetical protein